MLSILDTIRFREQGEQEAVDWAKTVHGVTDQQRLTDYRAGFQAGYHAAINDMRRHGYKFSTGKAA